MGSGLDSSFASEMAGLFLEEVEDQLHIMEQEILRLERDGASDETVQNLFRAAHTLKGSSAVMGFDEMKRLTHEMEHVLDQVRNRRLGVSTKLVDLLFQCLDHLRTLKEQFMAGSGIFVEIGAIVHELRNYAFGSEDQPERPKEAAIGEAVLCMEDPETWAKVRNAQDQGFSVYDIQVRLVPDCPMKSVRAWMIGHRLRSLGEMLLTHPPGLEELEDAEENGTVFDEESWPSELRYLLACQTTALHVEETLLTISDVAGVRVTPFPVWQREGAPVSAAAAPAVGAPAGAAPADGSAAGGASGASAHEGTGAANGGGAGAVPAAEKRKARTIRVDVERLEHLMNLVGELVIDQTRIHQVGSVLHHLYAADETVDELVQVSDHLARVIGELQESVMKVRMLPIDQLFSRFPRMVRDLAQSLNKEIDLVIEGRETELDRTVIEEIGDPLIHLIRNAIDHGIEPAEERKRKGKPAKGRLRIAAAHEENQVVITVEDDGAGIDVDKIKHSALRKGLISEEELKKLSDPEALRLIFLPGFSTASSVTDISGRGVGMDIVRAHIEKLSGVIDIDSRPGEGTRFTIKLPLTLAIITGLLIRLSDRMFVVPMSSVMEIVRVPPEAIQTIKGDAVVVIREQVVPVVWLHDVFRIPRMRETKRQLPIIVVGTADKRMALVVDELVGNQEIVVKSLGSYVGKINGISGATILGDGQVALILEVGGIGRWREMRAGRAS